jgi:hypothetical protein
MRLNASFKWLLTASLVVLAAGSATAQQPSGGAGPAPDATVPSTRRAQLSPAEQLAQSDKLIPQMQQAATGIRHQLEKARAERDVVKTLCLNDKLSQIDTAIRSAQDRRTSLAASQGDSDAANHEYTIITVLSGRAQQLTAEANQCIGEELSFVGRTEVTTQVDPTLPGEDQTAYPPTDPTLVSAPPQCVSCTK